MAAARVPLGAAAAAVTLLGGEGGKREKKKKKVAREKGREGGSRRAFISARRSLPEALPPRPRCAPGSSPHTDPRVHGRPGPMGPLPGRAEPGRAELRGAGPLPGTSSGRRRPRPGAAPRGRPGAARWRSGQGPCPKGLPGLLGGSPGDWSWESPSVPHATSRDAGPSCSLCWRAGPHRAGGRGPPLLPPSVLQSTGTPRAGVVWAAERCQPLAHICGAASSRRQPASTFRPVPSILCQPEVVCPSPPEPTHVLSMHSATSDSPS